MREGSIKQLRGFARADKGINQLVELPPQHVTLVTVGKDFTDFLDEWLQYHMLIGVARFVVGFNECGDALAAAKVKLEPYLATGTVGYDALCECSPVACHGQLFQKVWKRLESSNHNGWIAVLDSDEFLVLENPQASIGQLMSFIQQFSVSVFLQWRIFGAGAGDGVDSVRGRASVLESLHHRARIDFATNQTALQELRAAWATCNHGKAVPNFAMGKSITQIGACKQINIHRCR
jgi:hypothetical protein